MNEEKFYELVTRYLSKETSNEENEQLQQLLKEKKINKLFSSISEQWEQSEKQIESDDFNLKRGLDKLTAKILRHEPQFQWEEEERKKIFILRPVFLKVAASIAIFIILSFGALYTFGVFYTKPISIAWNEKSTVMGEKYILTLMDGTNITLNADSKIKYPVRFGEESREVYLEGEAYFEVAHDSTKRFIVHAGELATTVLGTRFNINAFQNEKDITVSLLEGSVKVSANDLTSNKGDIILSPTQQLVYDKKNETSKVKTFEEQTTAGWKDNILVFDNEPLEKVLIKLQRTFGVQFELTDKSYNSKKIKGNFKNASFWTVAEVIKKATGLQYKTIKENNETKKIVFYKK